MSNDKGFWPAIIGGVLGFLGGIGALILGGLGAVYSPELNFSYVIVSVIITIIFSIVGIISGTAIKRKKFAGGLMIFSGIMVLIGTGLLGILILLGVLTFIMFLIGGIRILRS